MRLADSNISFLISKASIQSDKATFHFFVP